MSNMFELFVGRQGGCASSRLDDGLEDPVRGEAALAADLITAFPGRTQAAQSPQITQNFKVVIRSA